MAKEDPVHSLLPLSSVNAQRRDTIPAASGINPRIAVEGTVSALLPSVIDSIPSAILVVDEQMRMVVVNASARELLCIGDTSQLGYSVTRFLSQSKLEAACQVLLSRMGRYTYRDTLRSGSEERSIEVAADLFLSEGASFVCLTLEDKTHIDRELAEWRTVASDSLGLEAGTATLRDGPGSLTFPHSGQLERARHLEALGQLTSTLAHDFNNLLTVIQTSLETAKLRLQRGGDPLTDIQRALVAANSSIESTSEILRYSRQNDEERDSIEPTRVLTRVTDLLRRALANDAHLEVEFTSQSQVRLKSMQLETAVLNLVINARDALPSGGSVRISVSDRTLEQEQARLLGVPPGKYVVVGVADNGVGMSHEVKARALEPFFTTKPEGTGTGLGLSAVRTLVERAGGAIRLDTREGHGTLVEMLFPELS